MTKRKRVMTNFADDVDDRSILSLDIGPLRVTSRSVMITDFGFPKAQIAIS